MGQNAKGPPIRIKKLRQKKTVCKEDFGERDTRHHPKREEKEKRGGVKASGTLREKGGGCEKGGVG